MSHLSLSFYSRCSGLVSLQRQVTTMRANAVSVPSVGPPNERWFLLSPTVSPQAEIRRFAEALGDSPRLPPSGGTQSSKHGWTGQPKKMNPDHAFVAVG